jgi:23S rRNA pseudouridine1911/1915/1917 synthase
MVRVGQCDAERERGEGSLRRGGRRPIISRMAIELKKAVAAARAMLDEADETVEFRKIRLALSREPKIRRVDGFLSQRYGVLSRTFFQKLIHGGQLTVNAGRVTPNYRVKAGDVIEFEIPVPPERVITAQPIPLEILYEDDDFFVINKAPGIICHPGKKDRDDTLANAFVYHMHGDVKGKYNAGIVHRLDVDTTGVMVVAKNPFAHVHLARQFELRRVYKEYLALVRGVLARPTGQIDAAIGYHPKQWGLMSTKADAVSPKHALSIYQVLERFRDYTLVSVVVKTGRTHQIRVHFEALGHPVVAEKYYRGELGPDPLEAVIPRQALHAWKLHLAHPRTREPMEFCAELPADFQAALQHLRGEEKEHHE